MKKSCKYDVLDGKILDFIKARRSTFQSLTAQLGNEAEALSPVPGDGWRVIDRRLQALRKAGEIFCERHGKKVLWFAMKAG